MDHRDSNIGGCGSYLRVLMGTIWNVIYYIHPPGYVEYLHRTRCRNDIFQISQKGIKECQNLWFSITVTAVYLCHELFYLHAY